MRDFVESDQETVREVLAMAMGRVVNHHHKCVRRRMQYSALERRLRKRAATSNERNIKESGYMCGTMMVEAGFNRLYRRHARLLLLLLRREGVYVVNSSGQVFGFREIGRQFGGILRSIENDHYKGLREIGAGSFDELNLDDQLVREHFSRRAENFIATVAEEEGLNFFLIGAVTPPCQRVF